MCIKLDISLYNSFSISELVLAMIEFIDISDLQYDIEEDRYIEELVSGLGFH